MDIIIDNTRKFLKARLLKDTTTLYGFEEKRANIKDLFNRTALHGESNSALLTSPKQGGKTTVSVFNKFYALYSSHVFLF